MRFQFALGGASLAERQVSRQVEVAVLAATTGEARAERTEQGAPAASSARLEKAKQVAGVAGEKSSLVGGILGGLGALLPGAIGQRFKGASGKMRGTQTSVSRSVRVPKVKIDRAKKLRGQIGKAAAKSSRGEEKGGPSVSQAGQAVEPAEGQVVAGATVVPARQTVVETWAETPFLEPGETMKVDLVMDPVRPHQSQDCSFSVISRGMEQKDAPPVVEEGKVQIVGVSWFRLYLPPIAFGVVSTMAILVIASLMTQAGLLSL